MLVVLRAHVDGARVEVDRVPRQASGFARAHAGEAQRHDQRAVAAAVGVALGGERQHLLGRQGVAGRRRLMRFAVTALVSRRRLVLGPSTR